MKRYVVNFQDTNLFLGEGSCLTGLETATEFRSEKRAWDAVDDLVATNFNVEVILIAETRKEKVLNWWENISDNEKIELSLSVSKMISNLTDYDLEKFYKNRKNND